MSFGPGPTVISGGADPYVAIVKVPAVIVLNGGLDDVACGEVPPHAMVTSASMAPSPAVNADRVMFRDLPQIRRPPVILSIIDYRDIIAEAGTCQAARGPQARQSY